MLKGLAITPPVLGRISIGRVVERNGKRLPEKDDQFTITSQVQTKEGWVLHPLDEALRQNAPNGKLRSIPVTLLFSDTTLNLRAEYSLFALPFNGQLRTGQRRCLQALWPSEHQARCRGTGNLHFSHHRLQQHPNPDSAAAVPESRVWGSAGLPAAGTTPAR